ncbi:MAG: hypothetical protein VB064_08260 [Oscillospiraceae bacterium]|nr:hypothetical protein [Oscillospiraceae bacterium]
MKKFLHSLKETTTNFAAESAAKYKLYLERENAALHEEAEILQYQKVLQNAYAYFEAYYPTLAELLMIAINNTVEITHIVSVRFPEQLTSPTPVRKSKKGYYYFVFQRWYRQGYGMTSQAIQRILQSELNTLASVYGFPKIRIHVELNADGRIIFRLAIWADVAGRIMI